MTRPAALNSFDPPIGLHKLQEVTSNPFLDPQEPVPEIYLTPRSPKEKISFTTHIDNLTKVNTSLVAINCINCIGQDVYQNARSTVLALGYLHVVTGVSNILETVRKIFLAENRHDIEAKIESLLRLLGVPLAMANAIENIIIISTTILMGTAFVAFSASALAAGALVLFIELGLEIYRLITIKHLRTDLHFEETSQLLQLLAFDPSKEIVPQIFKIRNYIKSNIENISALIGEKLTKSLLVYLNEVDMSRKEKEKIDNNLRSVRILITEKHIRHLQQSLLTLTDKNIEKINERVERLVAKAKDPETAQQLRESSYESLKLEVLQGKVDRLARRIGVEMTTKIKSYYLDTQSIQSKKEWIEAEKKSYNFFATIQEQTEKSLLIHLVGLSAIILGITLLACSFAGGAPLAIVIVISTFAMILNTARFISPRSYLDQDGHTFCWQPWIDDIKSLFYTKKKIVKIVELKTLSRKTS